MKRIWAVFKKEIIRFFTDVRMLLALIVPGIAIFIVYSLIGNVFTPDKVAEIDKNYQFKVALTNNYSSDTSKDSKLETQLVSFLDAMGYSEPKFEKIDPNETAIYMDKLTNKELDSLIIFDDNFEDSILIQNENRPDMDVYYNSEMKESEILFSILNQVVGLTYSNFTVNADIMNPNVGKESQMMTQIMGVILPLITISLIYAISLTVCPESIAGEKERGTLSSILLTPIKRSEFAIGKILALVVVCIFGSAISATSVMLSLPQLLKGSGMNISIPISAYILLGVIFLTLSIFFVSFATAISTYAKTTKEATGYLGPLNVLFLLISLCVGFVDCSGIGFAFIPILNSCQSMYMIINGTIDIAFLLTTLAMNVVSSIIIVFIDAKLFSSERIVMRQ